jgi:hypothetical protein
MPSDSLIGPKWVLRVEGEAMRRHTHGNPHTAERVRVCLLIASPSTPIYPEFRSDQGV